jgi:hypothetical protein
LRGSSNCCAISRAETPQQLRRALKLWRKTKADQRRLARHKVRSPTVGVQVFEPNAAIHPAATGREWCSSRHVQTDTDDETRIGHWNRRGVGAIPDDCGRSARHCDTVARRSDPTRHDRPQRNSAGVCRMGGTMNSACQRPAEETAAFLVQADRSGSPVVIPRPFEKRDAGSSAQLRARPDVVTAHAQPFVASDIDRLAHERAGGGRIAQAS